MDRQGHRGPLPLQYWHRLLHAPCKPRSSQVLTPTRCLGRWCWEWRWTPGSSQSQKVQRANKATRAAWLRQQLFESSDNLRSDRAKILSQKTISSCCHKKWIIHTSTLTQMVFCVSKKTMILQSICSIPKSTIDSHHFDLIITSIWWPPCPRTDHTPSLPAWPPGVLVAAGMAGAGMAGIRWSVAGWKRHVYKGTRKKDRKRSHVSYLCDAILVGCYFSASFWVGNHESCSIESHPFWFTGTWKMLEIFAMRGPAPK